MRFIEIGTGREVFTRVLHVGISARDPRPASVAGRTSPVFRSGRLSAVALLDPARFRRSRLVGKGNIRAAGIHSESE